MEAHVIRDKAGRLVPMRFSPTQEVLWEHTAPRLDAVVPDPRTGELVQGDKIWQIVLKARQTYATTFYENLVFTRTTERANTNSLLIGNDLFTAGAIFEIAKRFYEHLPLPKLKPSRVKEIEFPFSAGPSRLRVVSAGSMGKGRGTTQTCIHASEVAFWPRPEVLLGVFQAMPNLPDTIWVLESTANGLVGPGQAFYEQWKAAIDGRSELEPIFIPWFTLPEYRRDPPVPEDEWDDDEKLLVSNFGVDGRALRWRRLTLDTQCEGSLDKFHQEYPSTPEEAFVFSGLPAFDHQAVLAQQKNIRRPIKVGVMSNHQFQPSPKGWIHVWQEPTDHPYVIGVDTAEGLEGGDYSCAQVIDMKTLEQVAIMHGTISPWDTAAQVVQLAAWYNHALVCVEVQGTGHAVQDYLIRVHNYPNLHMWRGKSDQIRHTNFRLYGWETTSYSRPLLIEAGRRAINSRLITIHDRSTLDEISKFSRSDTGRYAAEAGHDDRVLALLLALRSREENFHEVRAITLSDYVYADQGAPVPYVTAADPATHLSRRKVREAVKEAQAAAAAAEHAARHWMSL